MGSKGIRASRVIGDGRDHALEVFFDETANGEIVSIEVVIDAMGEVALIDNHLGAFHRQVGDAINHAGEGGIGNVGVAKHRKDYLFDFF